MGSNFLLSEELPGIGVQTRVAWAHQPTGRALVFVHGLGGKAMATWAGFLSLLNQEPQLAGWDVIFYGYDGLHERVVSSAGLLRAFLTDLHASPEAMYATSRAPVLARPSHPACYEKIVLAAHSLGAVVARRALLDAFAPTPPLNWANVANLVLYAPAHRGASVMEWFKASPLGALAGLVAMLQLTGRCVALDDLESTGGTIRTLAMDLGTQFDAQATPNLRARAVFQAQTENFVDMTTLPPDMPPTVLNNRDHGTICKPDFVRTQPFDVLVAHL